MKFMSMLLIALSFALLFGCTGSSQPGNPNSPAQPPAPPAATPPQSQGQPQVGDEVLNAQPDSGVPAGNPNANSGPDQSAANSLLKYLGISFGNGYTASYDLTSTGAGYITSGKMTNYFRGVDKMRVDSAFSGYEGRSYILGNEIYSCYAAGSSWSCSKLASFNKTDADKAKDDIKANPGKYKIEKLPSRTILGVATECFKSTTGNGWAEYCFSPEGVTLYLHTEGAEGGVTFQSTMTATSYKPSASDSDFVLPATPSTAPAYPGMGGSGSSVPSAGASAYAGVDCSMCDYLSGSAKEDCLAGCG